MVCLPEADAPGRRLMHRPTLQGWRDPGSSEWSAWLTVLTQLSLQRVRKPASAGFRRTPRMPSLRPPWRVSEPQSEKVQAAQQAGHQGVSGSSLEGSSCKVSPEGGRNYFERDPQPPEAPDITARSLGDITGPESPDSHSACWPPLPFLCEPMLLETSASPHRCQGQGAASRSWVPPADACSSSYAATVTCRGGRLGSLLLEHVPYYRRSFAGLAPFSPPACADVP